MVVNKAVIIGGLLLAVTTTTAASHLRGGNAVVVGNHRNLMLDAVQDAASKEEQPFSDNLGLLDGAWYVAGSGGDLATMGGGGSGDGHHRQLDDSSGGNIQEMGSAIPPNVYSGGVLLDTKDVPKTQEGDKFDAGVSDGVWFTAGSPAGGGGSGRRQLDDIPEVGSGVPTSVYAGGVLLDVMDVLKTQEGDHSRLL